MSLGSAFLAGAFVFRENHVQRKSYVSRVAVPSRGSCFPRKKACPDKSYVSRIGVPSRGSCFLRKTCPGQSHVSRVGVPSRGFCFLRITCPEKSYVSRVAVPSRGSCLPRKTCPAKNFISWVGYIGIGSFPFLCPLILKGRSWDPRQKSGPHIQNLSISSFVTALGMYAGTQFYVDARTCVRRSCVRKNARLAVLMCVPTYMRTFAHAHVTARAHTHTRSYVRSCAVCVGTSVRKFVGTSVRRYVRT